MKTFDELIASCMVGGCLSLSKLDLATAVGWNAGKCDVLTGYCSCGAVHILGERVDNPDRLNDYGRELLEQALSEDHSS